MSLLMTILPIVLVGGFVWWFFKRIMVKNQTRMDEYIKRQKEHMERIEQTLERIAKAVEKKDPN